MSKESLPKAAWSGLERAYQSAVIISGLVTSIAAYHYVGMFNTWIDAHDYSPGSVNPSCHMHIFNVACAFLMIFSCISFIDAYSSFLLNEIAFRYPVHIHNC